MKLLRVLIASVFALSSVTVHAESTTKPEAAPVATTELTAEQKKVMVRHLKQTVKMMNSAGNLKGFFKALENDITPELKERIKADFAALGVTETTAFPKCSTKNMTIMCDGQTVEIVGETKYKINGNKEYVYEKDKSFYSVMTDIASLVKNKSPEGGQLYNLFIPKAQAFFGGLDGTSLLLGGVVGFLVAKWLFPDKPKEKTVIIREPYWTSPPVQPVDGGVDYSGKVNKATKAKTKEKANK